MALWHLDDLEAALDRQGWRIDAVHPGDNYRVSASWELRRYGDSQSVMLDFDGNDDLECLPMEHSYACSVRGTRLSLHFRRHGGQDRRARERWKNELESFVAALGGECEGGEQSE